LTAPNEKTIRRIFPNGRANCGPPFPPHSCQDPGQQLRTPTYANPLPKQPRQPPPSSPQYVLPAHPYSSNHSVLPAEESSKRSINDNPFLDSKQSNKEQDTDAASFYSAASNPFESYYVQPGSQNRAETPEGYSGSPFFTPHPDSSVQGEKWGSVGKERNVQESYASTTNGGGSGSDKLGSLIAALDLDKSEEEKADRSLHGHLGKFDV